MSRSWPPRISEYANEPDSALGGIYHSHQMDDTAVSMLDRVVRDVDPYWSPKAEQLLAEIRGVSVERNPPASVHSTGSVLARRDEAIESRGLENDPVVVVLSDVSANPTPPAVLDDRVRQPAPEPNGDGRAPAANPFAGLAVESDEYDVAPSTRNPYAELAPNFDATTFELPEDVQPGDWESLLGDWATEPSPDPVWDPPNKSARKRAFSRYT